MPTIGETLREARLKKGVSEEVAARAAKIRADRLRDLEQDRYDQFAAHLYARGFLRLYAEYLGLDAAELVKRFTDEHPAPPQKPIFEITEEQRARSPILGRSIPVTGGDSLTSTGKIVLSAAGAIFLLLLAAGFWAMRGATPTRNGDESSSVAPSRSLPENDPVSSGALETPAESAPTASTLSPTNAPTGRDPLAAARSRGAPDSVPALAPAFPTNAPSVSTMGRGRQP